MNSPRPIFLSALALSLPLLLTSCIGPCGVDLPWSGSGKGTEKTILTSDQYAPAETVYRAVLPGGQMPEAKTNFVYRLSFGNTTDPLPADFMMRFSDSTTTVMTGTNGLIFTPGRVYQPAPGKDYIVQPGRKSEAASDRDVVEITFYWVSFHDDRARARFYYSSGSENITGIINIAKRHGEWSLTCMNEEMRTYF